MDTGKRWKMIWKGLVNPAGGLAYHHLAWRYRRRLWMQYRQELKHWLGSWSVSRPRLLIIGPSGGYNLPSDFLRLFSQVDCVDPDPLAPHMFRLHHRGVLVQWHQEDRFGLLNHQWSKGSLTQLLQTFPDHAVLFANFLGQVRQFLSEAEKEDEMNWTSELQLALRERQWATFHDSFSFASKRFQPFPLNDNSSIEPEQILDQVKEQLGLRLKATTTLTVSDHGTAQLFQSFPRRYLWWQRQPGYFHLIEAVHHRSNS